VYNPFDELPSLKSPIVEIKIFKAAELDDNNTTSESLDVYQTVDPFIISLPLLQPINELYVVKNAESICKFWDAEQSNWASSGCSMINYTQQVITCGCYHLTNFVVDFPDFDLNGDDLDEEDSSAITSMSLVRDTFRYMFSSNNVLPENCTNSLYACDLDQLLPLAMQCHEKWYLLYFFPHIHEFQCRFEI
jgi:hypothetical protein